MNSRFKVRQLGASVKHNLITRACKVKPQALRGELTEARGQSDHRSFSGELSELSSNFTGYC